MSPSPQFKKLLARKIHDNRKKIWDWTCSHAQKAPPPFYCSVDLRDSGYKIVPVDSNLYPAGFNNICPEDIRNAPHVLRAQIDSIKGKLGLDEVKRILVVPENHTSNLNYIENLFYLCQVIREGGFEVELGWLGALPEGMSGEVKLVSATGKKLVAHPISVDSATLKAGSFAPDLIILNNDFSRGYPKELDGVKQPILPSHALGWHSRKKSNHFVHYNRLAREFAEIVEIDPWLLQIETEEVEPVNFNEDQGTEDVAKSVERVLAHMTQAFEAHGIKRKPFAFIKNNAGTYGMGIMTAHSADELRKMNRRTKNKMSVGKNRTEIHSVVVQEGIPTATLVDRLPAEPVIYLMGSELIGGFLRTNAERDEEGNLNSPGMVFRKLCMSDLRKPDEDDIDLKDEPMLELVYGTIARISALAAGAEMQAAAKQ